MEPEIIELFIERFPKYTFSLPLWFEGSEKDLAIPPGAELLYLYGIGDGKLPSQVWHWLKENSKYRVVFLEPDSNRIVELLEKQYARDLLECKQIEIVHLSGRYILKELAEQYPLRGVHVLPFSIVDRRNFHRVKAQLLRKTALTHAHFLERLHGYIPFSHLVKNLQRLPSAFYANRLKGAFVNVPAVICGAGPSLAASIEELRQLENRALILAGGSAIAVLNHYGITPHFALAIDPNSDEIERLKNSYPHKVPLLFSSRLIPEAFAGWRGPLGYLRSGMAGIPELWFEEQLGLTEPVLGEKLSPESLSITSLAAAFAVHLGCNPILFDGVDLAYTDHQRYAKGVVFEEQGGDLQPIDRRLSKRDRTGKMTESAVRWVMEAQALARFAKKHRDRCWINSTQGGLGLKGIETRSFKDLNFTQTWNLREMICNAIQNAPMPSNTKIILEEKMAELRGSLQNVIAHLEVLIGGKNSVLAELELKEEMATSLLFFDYERTIRTALGSCDQMAIWKLLHEIAVRYLTAASSLEKESLLQKE